MGADRPVRSFGRPDSREPEPVVMLPTVRMPGVVLPVRLELDPEGLRAASELIQRVFEEAASAGLAKAIAGIEAVFTGVDADDSADRSTGEAAGAAAVPG